MPSLDNEGKPEYLEETHTGTWRVSKLHTVACRLQVTAYGFQATYWLLHYYTAPVQLNFIDIVPNNNQKFLCNSPEYVDVRDRLIWFFMANIISSQGCW